MINKQRGVTLVEMMIAVAIVSIAVVPLISMVIQGAKGTQQLADRTLSSQLCQDMIEEIKQKRWDETTQSSIGLDGVEIVGGLRLNWNDIDDYINNSVGTYNGTPFDEHLTEEPPVDITGTQLDPRFDKFVRETVVRYVNVPLDGDVAFSGDGSGSGAGNPTTQYKLVEVWVSWNESGIRPSDVNSDNWVFDDADFFVRTHTIIAQP